MREGRMPGNFCSFEYESVWMTAQQRGYSYREKNKKGETEE